MSKGQVRLTAIALFLLISITSSILAQNEDSDERVILRYKQILQSKPREGSAFDRLYQFYLEGPGLNQMVADYQAESELKPNDPNIQLILGHIYKRLGKDQETVDAYRRAVGLNPGDYYPHFVLGKMYAMLHQYEEAIAELEAASKIKPVNLEDLTAIYKELGRAYFNRDRLNEAIAAWQKIAEVDPQDIFARIELAEIFLEQKLYPQAMAQHEAIIQLKKDDPYRICLSMREIGKIQEEMGKYDDAIKSYDEAIALTGPGNWLRKDLQSRVIGIYAHNGDWPGLIKYYHTKLEQTPNDVELMGLLADAYIENEQIDEGISQYRKGLELAPTNADLRLKLITTLRNVQQFTEATAEYEILSEQQPEDFGLYRELGELYVKLEQPEKARETYQRMLEHQPDSGTHLILAEIYAGHEWIDDAVAEYEKAIELAPDNLDLIEYFGEFYLYQGEREKAIETWNRLVSGENATSGNYSRLAKLLDGKEFQAEAVIAGKKAVELSPDEYRYREQLAKLLMETKDYEAALNEYERAAELAPNEFFAEQMRDQMIEIYRQQGTLTEKINELEAQQESFHQQNQLAKMYMKLGNMTYALEALRNASKLEPDDVRVNRRLGEIYANQGRIDDSEAIYKHLIVSDSANAREYYAAIARLHIQSLDFEAATEAVKQMIAHSPRNPEGYQLLAEIAEQIGDYAEATDSLDDAIRLRPESTEIRAKLADIYRQKGDHRQAIEQYWRCWELSDSTGGKLAFVNSLSDAYYAIGRGSELEEKLRQMAKTSPSDMGPPLALAELYRAQGNLPASKEQLARALEREPNNPDLISQLVKVSLDLGDTQEALGYQQRIVKLQPEPHSQQRLGELLFDMGREQEAIQVWTKLLHTKNKSIDAEVKLAGLLIRHGMLDEALTALDRAGEMATDAQMLYQIGAAFVEMNELDRAVPHFQKILSMPKPSGGSVKKTAAASGLYLPGYTDMSKITLPRSLVYRIQQPYSGSSGQAWSPANFDEAQAGALAQLTTIAQRQGRLDKWIEQLEAESRANPKDLQTIETLAQIYVVTDNKGKITETIDRLVALSPDDPVYMGLQFAYSLQGEADHETVMKHLDKMSQISPESRVLYASMYASYLYQQGKRDIADTLLPEIVNAEVNDMQAALLLVSSLTQMNKVDEAEKIIAQLPIAKIEQSKSAVAGTASPGGQTWQRYVYLLHRDLANAYLREGRTDKGIEAFWKVLVNTKPDIATARKVSSLAYSSVSYSGYRPLQTSFPSPSTYYDDSRMRILRDFFIQIWVGNQLEKLYAKLQEEFDAVAGRDRIYPGLALSYCYWWEGQRTKSQEVLAMLQTEFPEDLTLKLNTIYVSIQTGEHQQAIELLAELSSEDPRNRQQYNELALQLAIHTGNTVKVREVMTKVLNSPVNARALVQFAKKLQEGGLTHYGISFAKKAMNLAMGQRDPNFLMQLSQLLEQLGRGQDAAIVAERAMRFANQRDRYGYPMQSYYFQRASSLIRSTKSVKEREEQLVQAADKNPDSFQAQINLASYYESLNQVEKASKAFDKALELRPKDSITRQRYAEMLMRGGRAADAVTQYMLLLRDNPNAVGYRYWEVMEVFFDAGKVDEIASLAKDMISPPVGRSYGNDFARNVASRCLQNNYPKAAVEIYQRMLEVRPGDTYLYTQLASAYAAAGEREKAIEFLREKLDSSDPDISQSGIQVQMVLKLVELYKPSGDLQTLLGEYEELLAQNPDDSSLIYLAAMMRIASADQSDNVSAADELVARLVSDDPANVSWLNSLADAYRNAGDRERELRLLEQAASRREPQDTYRLAETYEKLGAAYNRAGDKEKAAEVFRKMGTIRILRHGGGYYHEKGRIADIYMQHGMWDDAEALYTEVANDLSADQYYRRQAQERLVEIKNRSDRIEATTTIGKKTQDMNVGMQRALAQQYMQRNDLENAAKIFKQLVEAMPEDYGSRAQLARIYSRQSKHDEAIAEWESLLEADPENTQYQDGLVNAHQSAGKISEALELAQKYIKGEPSSIHYSRLARIYTAGGRVDDAIDSYKKAIELNPGDSRVHQNLARLYIRRDDFDSAEKSYQEALKYTSRDYERSNIERQLMDLYRRQGKLEEMLQKAEEEGTLTFAAQRERARNYQNNGELDKAVEAYKKAMEMAPENWDRDNVANDLIRVYAQLGQNEPAIELYESLSRSSSSGMSIMARSSGIQIQFTGDRAREAIIGAYRDQGKLSDLLAYFDDRRQEEPGNAAVLEMVAEIHRSREDHEKTAQSYESLSSLQPGNVRSYYYAAAAFNQIGKTEKAENLLKQGEIALSSSDRNDDMYFLGALGAICLSGELYESAIKLTEDAIAQRGGYGGSSWAFESHYRTIVQGYIGTRNYEESIHAYHHKANLARESRTREEALTAIRQAYKDGGLYQTLIGERKQAVKDNPNDPDTHFALAQTYEWNDMQDEATAAYERAAQLNPDSKQILEPLAKLYAVSNFTKAKSTYKRLMELSDSYRDRIQSRRNLVSLYRKSGRLDEAISELRSAATSASEQFERESALRDLWGIYDGQDKVGEGLAIMEELSPQMESSISFHEMLGNAYKKAGDQEKANLAYTKWFELRHRDVEKNRRAWDYGNLAERLLDKEIMPEKALEMAQSAAQLDSNPSYAATLGRAYLVNGKYEEAIEELKRAFSRQGIRPDDIRLLWSNVIKAGKVAKDETRFNQFAENLMENMPDDPTAQIHANLALANFYQERDQTEEADRYLGKTGFIAEDAWWIVGPFDNAGGIGYNKAYIPEDADQIDTAVEYSGKDKKVKWEKRQDDTLDGFIDLDRIFGGVDWVIAYAYTIINSPEERQVQLRIGSDDQIKVWLNGESVFRFSQDRSAILDQDIIPVELKAGENRILVKCCEEGTNWGFYVRLTDMDGSPLGYRR